MKRLLFITLSLTLFFQSCDETNADKSDKDKGSIQKVASETLPKLRNPSEMALRLKAIGADYLPGIVNDTSKIDQYLTMNSSAAVNIGVYYADLEYGLIYNDFEASRMSASGVFRLAEALGFKAELDEAIKNSFDTTLTEEQRLLMLDKGLNNSRLKLNEGDDSKNATLIVSGFFVEQFYQLLQILNNYPAGAEPNEREAMMRVLYERISEQDVAVGNLLKHINAISSWTPEYKTFVNDMERLQLALTEMKSEEELKSLSADEIQSDPSLIKVRTQTLKLRGFIIQ